MDEVNKIEMEDIKIGLKIIFTFIALVGSIVISMQLLNMSINNVPTSCYVNDEIVYTGPSYAIKTETNGAATEVVVYGGLLYMFPQAVYVSSNVKLQGKK